MNINVYFISGMSANCRVFDHIILPDGFIKNYIEWIIPDREDSLEEYVKKMAGNIDTSSPFVLVGYSLGGIIIQEMNKILNPAKNIIIASIKREDEKPPLHRLGRKIKFADHFPWWSLMDNQKIKEWLAYFVYKIKTDEMTEYVSYTDPVYTQWCTYQTLYWIVDKPVPNLYHIHGTRDQMFPFKYLKDVYEVKGGDHLMVMKKHKKISAILSGILLDQKAEIKIRQEISSDYGDVKKLIKLAFENKESSIHKEHIFVEKLRYSNSFIPSLSLVAVTPEKQIVGHILLIKIFINGQTLLALAMISVLPSWQKKGIGSKLIAEAHQIAKNRGYGSIIVSGYSNYFLPSTYKRLNYYNIELPFSTPCENNMVYELIPDALAGINGTAIYPEEFFDYMFSSKK